MFRRSLLLLDSSLCSFPCGTELNSTPHVDDGLNTPACRYTPACRSLKLDSSKCPMSYMYLPFLLNFTSIIKPHVLMVMRTLMPSDTEIAIIIPITEESLSGPVS